MTLVLARVDQRLVHGQVLVGWVPVLNVDRLVVIDDEMADSDWERDMLESAAAPDTAVTVVRTDEASALLDDENPERIMVLVRAPSTLLALARDGVALGEINLGGMHARDGSRRFLDYLFLTEDDIQTLETLRSLGAPLVAQDLPGNRRVDISAELTEGRLVFDQLAQSQ